MDKVLEQIGERIKEARLAKGMSQQQLAEALNVSPPYISKIESGKNAMTVTVLIGISDTLGVSADWLLRNNTRESADITAEEFNRIIEDCTPAERDALMKLLQRTKETIRDIVQSKRNDD